MSRVPAVSIDDDLAAGETAVPDRAAHHEASGRIDVISGAAVEPLGREDRLDDFLHHRLAQRLGRDVRGVLRREHYGLDADRLVILVTQRHLALGVGTQPRYAPGLAHLSLALDQAMRQRDWRRHQYVGLLRGIAEHQALVAGALFALVLAVDTLGDVG